MPKSYRPAGGLRPAFVPGGAPRVTAVLGPTNTGKTYLAIERMMGHASGMMGFPLRLLARENYDRVAAIKGADKVALVTGEEKIVPPGATYFLCTVESMPLAREVAFMAVDEVQLAADAERGHVFTDRILNARGYAETMLLGSDTIAPMIRRLVPGCEFVSRPRFSRLAYAGSRKITRLPPRSAVVAFSAASVYGIAELLRRQRGGAAVVMGALSPRTRNAQVAMFQDGEVDYLVATDAIGMGLNMDVSHVAFGELVKFDGRRRRPLTAAELGQIAGRAGRHMSDGTFGTTADIDALAPELVEAVESHDFATVRMVSWRNPDLIFSHLRALLAALEVPAPGPGMVAKRDAPDHVALKVLSAEADIADAASGTAMVRLLWEVCQIPDFNRARGPRHARFLGQIFRHLIALGALPDDWVGARIARLDRTDGDIDTLTARIEQIRTWTYISHRADWMRDAGHWQGLTRDMENRLSDALHDRLTQRFVDRRTTALIKGLKGKAGLSAGIGAEGDVTVEGHFVGRLVGLRFVADSENASGPGEDKAGAFARRAVRAAAGQALAPEIIRRLDAIDAAGDDDLVLADDGRILWRDEPVACLTAGARPLQPSVRLIAGDLVDAASAARLTRALEGWLKRHLARHLRPLIGAAGSQIEADMPPPARGLLYQVAERLGAVPRRDVDSLIRSLDAAGRKLVAKTGLRLGTQTIYLDRLGSNRQRRLRAILAATHRGLAPAEVAASASLAADGRPSIPRDPAIDPTMLWAAGFVTLGPRALSFARAEALAAEARKLARQGAFAPTRSLRRLAGGSADDLIGVLIALGFKAEDGPEGVGFATHRRPKPSRARASGSESRSQRRARGTARKAADSPFAKLRELRFDD